MADKSASTAPLQHSAHLAEQVMARLVSDIRTGRLGPGARLPTEQALTEALGVSRAVVREAIAALRADRLIVTRRGSGAYGADPSAGPFAIAAAVAAALSDTRTVRELRLAVDVEAAGFAAERGSRRQIAAIRAAWRAIDRALQAGEGAVAEDFAFHRAIAEATGNRQFSRFLAFLGSHVIPRQCVRLSIVSPGERRYLLQHV